MTASQYLLTGGSGLLGTEIQKYIDCFAPSHKILDITTFTEDTRAHIAHGRAYYGFDPPFVFNQDFAKKLKSINTVLHLSAYTNVPQAEIERDEATRTNIIGTYNMANYACSMGWQFVYVSTDYVYDCISGNYKETDQPNPINFYAQTKYIGETFIKPKDLIIRTSFKPRNLWTEKYNQAFTDIYTSADYVDIIAPMIVKLIQSGASGVFNVGTERKSLYELAQQTNPNIKPMSREVIKNVKMPIDASMNTDKYKELFNE